MARKKDMIGHSSVAPEAHVERSATLDLSDVIRSVKRNSTTFKDNPEIARVISPVLSGFLVSFLVDARGGAMRGCRHSGVRMIIPPGKASMPTRVTCKLVRREKLAHPPPLMEGEGLASRVLELGPIGAKFNGAVLIEVPHFGSLRGNEREVVILRSDNGETWREHNIEPSDGAIQDALGGCFEDLESAEELYNKRITRILTSDFPHYFAVVSRVRQETRSIGPEAGMLSSTVVPAVQAVFPEGALTKKIRVGLQALAVPPELVARHLGGSVSVSPVVTVEPRRRRFHQPITLTIPQPEGSHKTNKPQKDSQSKLRLLCSITGGTNSAHWEDITLSTPLTQINDCVSFTTTVSARFWLINCPNPNDAAQMATLLYGEVIAVPFMSKFVVFGKTHESQEARLRVFCMTDDKMDKTLESQEHFTEIARSRDVEVLQDRQQYVEMTGNLVPVAKGGEELQLGFVAFQENRLPFLVCVKDPNLDRTGLISFAKDPRATRGQDSQICNLNVTLPKTSDGNIFAGLDATEIEDTRTSRLSLIQQGEIDLRDQYHKADFKVAEVAERLGANWPVLATSLGLTDSEVDELTGDVPDDEKATAILQAWINGGKASGNALQAALKMAGLEDVAASCCLNNDVVDDDDEKLFDQSVIIPAQAARPGIRNGGPPPDGFQLHQEPSAGRGAVCDEDLSPFASESIELPESSQSLSSARHLQAQVLPADDDSEQTTKITMKKQVHKKTILKDGKEETIVTEDANVEQDQEGPEELRESMQQVIDQFMEGDATSGKKA